MKQGAKDLRRWNRPAANPGTPIKWCKWPDTGGPYSRWQVGTWSKCHLLLFQIQDNLSSYLHQSPSAHLQLCQDQLVTATLPWWLKSYSFLRWMSSHQNKSCTRTAAFGPALIAPHSESILVWSKKKDVTKGKFSFTKINSTEIRDWPSSRQTCLDGFLSLLPVKSHNQSSS